MRLLEEGIDMIRILEVDLELVEGDEDENEGLEPWNWVLCLGIERRGEVGRERGVVGRFGMFCLPRDFWVRASPVKSEVIMG